MLSRATYQLELFLLSLSFFTRIPVPASVPYSTERMNQSGRYFSLVGLLLGLICYGVYSLCALVLPEHLSILLMMGCSLLLTGAFHEDGLTDMADGIGGGMTTERRLAIMKDSRIGTYGAAALIMALLMKYSVLSSLAMHASMLQILLVGNGLSRAVAASLIYDMPYVSDIHTSKSKPLASRQTARELGILLFFGIIPCIGLDLSILLIIGSVSCLLRFALKQWLLRRIGGFTGDCLGGVQQITELAIYLIFAAMMMLQVTA
ncbi:adenosylcobinamide-GDP ribazoletransferase [Vibrio gazogenes]|uniref:Adenosylcobinamide-GDP ribazoletransferase n=1 Tax=Vibrio gazogenes DSM 21264 = NBRC 103151 TaxID=1123492 RepID=A0A1M5AJ05_VIBGA|nr:adenosylcobinamide-GDP ribazoletransferase [Vibrio gazogenes]USP12602.1 adenosylcobinamide-GDP ribazoletransferase [Vibrio gazogenes]SHF30259.1 cobalamin-5'-phosphate synthase [Vibrio gazogenes DSM 21264] [Vibrio gazogenes DSM 21264 = NBRC 103151]SJN57824.1 Cobalamin synthase [Vibrio gazogenes]